MGKVGLALSGCLSDAGYRTIGVDIDAALVGGILRGDAVIREPGVADLIKRSIGSTLFATTDVARAINETDISFVIVPTPSNESGGFSLKYVLDICRKIGSALKQKKTYHVIGIVSTVLPGSSEYIIIPCLEEICGRHVGDTLGYCYNPAFIALGEVVQGFTRPDYVLIGEYDKRSGDIIEKIHRSIVKNRPPVARMRIVEAEITKLASNTHETMRVSFANMLCSLCTEISGTNVDHITEALAHRMGRRFFKGAVPYGGPCWPRDNVAISTVMDAVGISSILPRAVHQFNAEHGKYIFNNIIKIANRGDKIGLIGLSYKPGTAVVEESYGVRLANWLIGEGLSVCAWDPHVTPGAIPGFDGNIKIAPSGNDCLKCSTIVVVVNVLPEIGDLNWSLLKDGVVVDCWRQFDRACAQKVRRYIPLGIGLPGESKSLIQKVGIERLKILTE